MQTPPNFLVQSDLRSYVTPVVILPPEESIPENDSVIDGNLIDTSDSGSAAELVDLQSRNGSISPDVLAERLVPPSGSNVNLKHHSCYF